MTKEEIIELARQSGAMFDHMTWVERDLLPVFERFATLVAEHEREACALIADKSHRIFRDTKDAHDRNSPNSEPFNPNAFGFSVYAIEESLRITSAIRARGQE
jgi:hypothetical protein